MKLLAQGTNFDNLGNFEDLIPEGARVRFIARLEESLYEDELDAIWEKIESHGVVVLDVRQTESNKLIIDAEKHLGPLIFIGLALVAVIAIPIMIFSWRLFLMDPKDMFTRIILPIGIISVLGLGLIAYIAKPHKKQLAGAAKLAGRGAVKAAPYVAVGARKAVMKV